jgi:hypothetical protein
MKRKYVVSKYVNGDLHFLHGIRKDQAELVPALQDATLWSDTEVETALADCREVDPEGRYAVHPVRIVLDY